MQQCVTGMHHRLVVESDDVAIVRRDEFMFAFIVGVANGA